jgi:sugar phosphate isomerase/epimerase
MARLLADMSSLARRSFLIQAGASALAMPALVRAAAPPGARLPLAFSTLGCPKWNRRTVLDRAAGWGYAAIEIRGLEGEMDLTKCAPFSKQAIAGTLKDLDGAAVRIVGLGASTRLHEAGLATRAAQLDEGRRFIDLAHALRAPFVRVFGDAFPAGEPRAAVLARVIEGLRELGTHARGSGVSVLLESHGDFTDSATLGDLLERVAMDSVGLLWDTHHTVVSSHETPAHTFDRLGRFLRHVHLKDSRPAGQGVHYVLTGEGTVPLAQIVGVLVKGGYRGAFCFEWEKRWHPDIPEPEVAFPHFARVMKERLAAAGYRV